MIKEAYCSKEVSILLKEKGFNEKCRGGYHYEFDDNDNPIVMLEEWTTQPYNNDFVDEGFLCSAPTIQMAMAWLREKYNIYISIQPDFPSDKDYKMCWCWTASILHENCVSLKGYQCYIETYEKATEEAIKYCLENLI